MIKELQRVWSRGLQFGVKNSYRTEGIKRTSLETERNERWKCSHPFREKNEKIVFHHGKTRAVNWVKIRPRCTALHRVARKTTCSPRPLIGRPCTHTHIHMDKYYTRCVHRADLMIISSFQSSAYWLETFRMSLAKTIFTYGFISLHTVWSTLANFARFPGGTTPGSNVPAPYLRRNRNLRNRKKRRK